MRALAAGLLLWSISWIPLGAQASDRSLERIAIALERPHPVIGGIEPADPSRPKRLSIFTLVPPELPGEIVRVSVPIGELVSRAFAGVATAKQRRHVAAARRRVAADLKWFAAQQPPPH